MGDRGGGRFFCFFLLYNWRKCPWTVVSILGPNLEGRLRNAVLGKLGASEGPGDWPDPNLRPKNRKRSICWGKGLRTANERKSLCSLKMCQCFFVFVVVLKKYLQGLRF